MGRYALQSWWNSKTIILYNYHDTYEKFRQHPNQVPKTIITRQKYIYSWIPSHHHTTNPTFYQIWKDRRLPHRGWSWSHWHPANPMSRTPTCYHSQIIAHDTCWKIQYNQVHKGSSFTCLTSLSNVDSVILDKSLWGPSATASEAKCRGSSSETLWSLKRKTLTSSSIGHKHIHSSGWTSMEWTAFWLQTTYYDPFCIHDNRMA